MHQEEFRISLQAWYIQSLLIVQSYPKEIQTKTKRNIVENHFYSFLYFQTVRLRFRCSFGNWFWMTFLLFAISWWILNCCQIVVNVRQLYLTFCRINLFQNRDYETQVSFKSFKFFKLVYQEYQSTRKWYITARFFDMTSGQDLKETSCNDRTGWKDGPVGKKRRCTDFLFLVSLSSFKQVKRQ